MNRQILLITLAFIGLFISCNFEKTNFSITGTLSNADKNLIKLEKFDLRDMILIDSSVVTEEGIFKFKGLIEEPTFFLIRESKNNFITILVEPDEQMSITADIRNLQNTYTITGSPGSEKIRQLNQKAKETYQLLDSIEKIRIANLKHPYYDTIFSRLKKDFDSVLVIHRDFLNSFINNDPASMVNMMALFQRIGNQYALSMEEHFTIFEKVDAALMARYPASKQVQALHAQVGDMKKTIDAKRTKEEMLGLGAVAPNIALPSPEGDTIDLYSLRGKYVLLDFWASWCSPCRMENPNLVSVFHKYKDKGFEIFQVSLDKTHDAWVAGIKADKLEWNHVSDLQFWNSVAARLYEVRSIPASFLLDPDGKIIATNLRGQALEMKLDEIFNKK
ncbi:MAG: TlpA disulfide reductase family protein [Bacteroidota bacterium]